MIEYYETRCAIDVEVDGRTVTMVMLLHSSLFCGRPDIAMNRSQPPFFRMTFLLILGLAIPIVGQELEFKKQSVFDLPIMLAKHQRLKLDMQRLIDAGDYAAATDKCKDAIKLFPEEPSNYYVLACCQARLGQTKEALLNLELAIDHGFNDAVHIRQNSFLVPLRKLEGFDELLKRAPNAKQTPNPLLTRTASPSLIVDGVASVSETNTDFRPELNTFETSFKFAGSARLEGRHVTNLRTDVGMKVREWYMRGTGAGLRNHLYDNHDGGHSNLPLQTFPQLSRLEFCDEAKKRGLDHGLQVRLFYNAITIGNCSAAMTGKAFWRSLPRLAYSSPDLVSVLRMQYRNNHLYVYPEHHDHDPDQGDVFASNTPYVLISQGSSGSDQMLLKAVAWTLASLQPKTKRKLVDGGALMPAVQMIFRRTNQRVATVEDYLSGKAHPTVFDGNTIDQMRLIQLAHAIKPEEVPPVVQLRVIEEDEPSLGIDYFDDLPRVKLFETPSAVTRLLKSTKQNYRMVVSIEQSFDLNDRPLTNHWRVLRGDASKIKITPLTADHSKVEIVVPYQESRPIEPGSELHTTRVDIGAFVHNGHYYSAPAFVSLNSPRNETRTYNEHGKIESMEYHPFAQRYEDPILTTPREWTDRYAYDENQHLIGWTRTREASVEQFTADGAIVIETDELGRASIAQTVTYQRSKDPKLVPQILEQQLGPELLHYHYESPDDQIGRITKRESANPRKPARVLF